MEKGIFKTKTFYLGVAIFVYGIILTIQYGEGCGSQYIIIGLGVVFGRDTVEKFLKRKK